MKIKLNELKESITILSRVLELYENGLYDEELGSFESCGDLGFCYDDDGIGLVRYSDELN